VEGRRGARGGGSQKVWKGVRERWREGEREEARKQGSEGGADKEARAVRGGSTVALTLNHTCIRGD
jgi:hypothetical protein